LSYKLSIAVLLIIFSVVVDPVWAQEPLPQDLIKKVGFDQHLDEQVPLNLTFTDSTGQAVRLEDFFNDKPVILSLGYYECPVLCSFARNGLFESLKKLDFTVGEEFEVLVVSIDPAETPEIADVKKQISITEYGRSTPKDAWHFLVGDEDDIQQLAQAIGFRYTYDPKIDQYLHPTGIVVLTPQGKIARYFFGLDYPSRDLRLGLVEADANKIGSPVDQLLLMCYHYDPVTGEYSLLITNVIRIAGLVTVMVLGGFLLAMFRRSS
jgi:protein SCO1/2